MRQFELNDPLAIRSAKEISHSVISGDYDLLLACRHLASLRERLPEVSDDIMATFIGVASEVDGLPIGPERKQWSVESLISKDIEADDYRKRVEAVVKEALERLLLTLS